MREYVSFAPDINDVAFDRLTVETLDEFIQCRKDDADEKEFIQRFKAEKPDMFMEQFIRQCKDEKARKIAAGECEDKDPTTETQKQLFQNLSEEDARTIYCNLHGHIYPEVLLKMLDTFPKEVSKEIMFKYTEHCDLTNDVLIRVISIFGKDAKEIILREENVTTEVFNKIFRIFGKDDTKDILIALSSRHLYLSNTVERKILRLFSDIELKEILENFIEKNVLIGGELFSKIFDVCSSKEEIKELLDLAIANDMDIWSETLDKIVEYFPKDEAKWYLDAFFEKTSPGRCEYEEEQKKEYYNRLLTEEEREKLEED
jgi:plasmid maintenance system antidote protein VapI